MAEFPYRDLCLLECLAHILGIIIAMSEGLPRDLMTRAEGKEKYTYISKLSILSSPLKKHITLFLGGGITKRTLTF